MQYEMVILELMTRIQKLEDEVKTLTDEMEALRHVDSQRPGAQAQEELESEGETNPSRRREGGAPYMKMTDEMIDICYRSGKMLHDGESAPELADGVADETGMNRNSALIYLYAVKCMLEGTVYKRAISAKAQRRYYKLIFDEYGSRGLKQAIKATRLHIEYRRSCGHMVDSIEEICEEYERRL